MAEAPPPAAVLTNGAQQADKLGGLLPVRSSLAVAPPTRPLPVHGGQHLADVRGQQVIHLVALQMEAHMHTRAHTACKTQIMIFFVAEFILTTKSAGNLDNLYNYL